MTAKCFRCVHHNILLEKLKFYGIYGTFYTLVKSYLEGRYQKVIIANSNSNHNTSSNWMEIKHSPSELDSGSFVCLICINDLPTLSNNTQISLYADDTSINVTSSNSYNYQIIIKDIFYINWFKANLLPPNLEKKKNSMVTTYKKLQS